MSVKVSRILHAGYVIESDEAVIAFDTVFQNPFSGNCHAFPQVQFNQALIKNLHFDAVFISHFHDDHFCMESLNLLPRATTIYMFCVHQELLDLIKLLGFSNVTSLKLDSSVKIKDIEIIPRRALDVDVDSVFQIKVDSLNILNVVDSWIDYETLDLLKKEGPWDLIMWPFQTMRELEVLSPSRYPASDRLVPYEWLEQINILNPRYLIPSSCQFKMEPWSWYNQTFFPISYASFKEQVHKVNSQIHIWRLDPSESLCLTESICSSLDCLKWISKLPTHAEDYAYDSSVQPLAMSEVAIHFPVTLAIEEEVLRFCKEDLIQIYNKNSESAHEYFLEPLTWQLNLYSPQTVHSLFFKFQDGKILSLCEEDKEIGWKTEISLAKVYSALYQGEALTSLYIRVNDVKFSERIERKLSDVDAIEDPLIRSLYDGALGTYQKAQLKKLNII